MVRRIGVWDNRGLRPVDSLAARVASQSRPKRSQQKSKILRITDNVKVSDSKQVVSSKKDRFDYEVGIMRIKGSFRMIEHIIKIRNKKLLKIRSLKNTSRVEDDLYKLHDDRESEYSQIRLIIGRGTKQQRQAMRSLIRTLTKDVISKIEHVPSDLPTFSRSFRVGKKELSD